jgi:hypothetical protein
MDDTCTTIEEAHRRAEAGKSAAYDGDPLHGSEGEEEQSGHKTVKLPKLAV